MTRQDDLRLKLSYSSKYAFISEGAWRCEHCVTDVNDACRFAVVFALDIIREVITTNNFVAQVHELSELVSWLVARKWPRVNLELILTNYS